MLKILIVDDDEAKRLAIRAQLVALRVPHANILECGDAAEARRQLSTGQFDLMLLDILLPSRQGATASGDISVDLLREIVEDETTDTPLRIVGISSEASAIEKFGGSFGRLVTQTLLIDLASDDWRYSLRCLVANLHAAISQPRKHKVDVCLQTALREPELTAILSLPGVVWRPEEPLAPGLLFRSGEYELEGRTISLVCAHATQMGMIPAAHLASHMVHRFAPKLLLMTGFCGSGEKDTAVGDLIVAEKSWDWQAGKWDPSGSLLVAPDQKEATVSLVTLSRGFGDSVLDWYGGYSAQKPPSVPKVLIAPIASGSSVMSDSTFHPQMKKQHRKADGIDMECYGFYHSASLADEPLPRFVCMKGVADKADFAKADYLQRFCSDLSAAAALYVIKRYFGSSGGSH